MKTVEKGTGYLFREADELLLRAKLRSTRARRELVRVLMRAKRPMTHAQICERMERACVNRVTIYRTLETLHLAGIVHRIESHDHVWRFGICGETHSGHCHPHFTCRVCQKVECLRDLPMPRLPEVVSGRRIETQEVYVTGVCAECGERV